MKIKHFFVGILICGFFSVGIRATLHENLSKFEKRIVDDGLTEHKLKVVKPSRHQKIKNIYIYTESPFHKDGKWLGWLNAIHVNTRDSVILNSLLFKPGDDFNEDQIRDSEEFLRGQALVRSFVAIIPVIKDGESTQNEIDLLVASKDLISLQPNFSFEGTGLNLSELFISLGEHNLLGLGKSISVMYDLKPGLHYLSTRYFDNQFLGSRWQLTLKPQFIFAKKNFAFEGFMGSVAIARPLLSTTDKWGYGLSVEFGSRPVLRFKDDKIRTYNIPETPAAEAIEQRYRSKSSKLTVKAVRSFGEVHKKNVTLAYSLNIKRPLVPQDLNLTADQEAAFIRDILPKREIESYVTLGFNYYQNKFLFLHDYNVFNIQEKKTLGPSFSVDNDFALRPFLLSDHNFLRPSISISYLQALSDDSFTSTSASATTRWEKNFTDTTYDFSLRFASPKLYDVGRLIFLGNLSLNFDSRDHLQYGVGAQSGNRGITNNFYLGSKQFTTNLEARTTSIKLGIFYVGLVFFYDVGSAFDDWRKANPTHTVGGGIRVLTPQFSTQIFRLDFGFPVYGAGTGVKTVVPSFGTGQAF